MLTLPPTPPAEVRNVNSWTGCATSMRWVNADAWAYDVISSITKLEYRKPNAFGVSHDAAKSVKAFLSEISDMSLPKPRLIPLSGEGVMLVWKTGSRSVELTAFADGELVGEGIEDGRTLDEESKLDLLKWLVQGGAKSIAHAEAR